MDTPIDWIPGMIPLQLKDFPNFIHTTNPNNPMLDFVMSETTRSSKASAIIKNTFDELDHDVLSALSPMCPPIYTIGPLSLLFNQLIPESNNLKWMTSSLWKEDLNCLKWLDSKPQASVIYVNFGSIATLTARQLSEFAKGLAKSNKNFLWIVRPDLVQGENALLPPEYWEKVGGRGFMAGWCPQEQVLNHVAVGGFLTHGGWNSISESLCSGVPMLCWPFFADQHINSRYACDVWGVAMEINSDVESDEVRFLVSELLGGEKGKTMKKRAVYWKDMGAKAVGAGGSSYLNLDKLLRDVLNV